MAAASSPAAKLFSASHPPSTVSAIPFTYEDWSLGEIEGGVGDVGGDPRPPLRDHGPQPLLERVVDEVLLGQRRPDQARADRVHTDPGRAEIAGEALRQADHPVLRRRVGRTPREPDQPADRRDVDDHTAAGLAHGTRSGLAAVERAAQVDGDHVVPLFGGHRVDVADLAHAGAVHEHVDAPLRRHDLGDRPLHVCRRAHVAVDVRVARQVEADRARPLAREAVGDLAADPARGPSDQHHPVLQHPALLRSTLTP